MNGSSAFAHVSRAEDARLALVWSALGVFAVDLAVTTRREPEREGHDGCIVVPMSNDQTKKSGIPNNGDQRVGQLSTEPSKLEPTPERAHEEKVKQEQQASK